MKTDKPLSFGSLRHFISKHIGKYPDWRQEHKRVYCVHDAVMKCLTATHANGETTCSHKVLQAVIIHLGLP